MAQEKNIWKFNDDEWKVHIDKKEICDKLDMKFKLKYLKKLVGDNG